MPVLTLPRCLVLTLSSIGFVQAGNPDNGNVLISSSTTWRYLDDSTDPAAALPDRTDWTKTSFDDSAWKSGVGSFGAKNGAIASLGGGCTPNTLLKQYDDASGKDIPAYFFRTTITVSDAASIKRLTGSLLYDDSAIVYINGVKVAAFDEPSGGFSSNLSYGGSNAGSPKTGEILVTDTSMLQNGSNTVAVELHQGRESSSDIYLDFTDLRFSTEAPAAKQDSISLTPGTDASQVNINWYADSDEAGTVRYAPTSQLVNGALPESAKTASANSGLANKLGYHYFKATLSDLAADTAYSYQLVNGSSESPVYSFRTQPAGAFTFLYVGDPQIGAGGSNESDAAAWANSLKVMSENFPNSAFLLSAGDQVNTASSEEQYAGYLNSTYMPSIINPTVVGNHDSSSSSYDQHYNIANESDYGRTAAGGDSWFTYNNVLFLQLNDNNMSTAEHKAFMQDAIQKNSSAAWKIAVMHHSLFSVASHAYDDDILARRNELAPVFKDLDIDVVLMGHDHVYVRSYMMDGTTPMTDASLYDNPDYTSITNPTGILYMTANSGSGSKYYTIRNDEFAYARVKNQERVPNFSVVTVSDNEFTITTKRVTDLSNVDSFTIYHYDPADYSAVDNAIEAASGLNPDLYKDFTPVSDAVNAVVRNKLENEQSTVDGYAKAIESAIAGLQFKEADYSAVNAAIAKAKALDPAAYKDFSAVDRAVKAVVPGKSITEQAVVDHYAEDIESAIAGLQPKKNSSKPETQNAGSSKGKGPNTGDSTNVAALCLAIVAVLALLAILLHLRRENGRK